MQDQFPKLKEIFQLRKHPEMFFWVCDNFLSVAVGKTKFRKLTRKVSVSEVASRSDEAYMMLVLENNWKRWMNMAETGSMKSTIPTKYTERGKKAKVYGGWTMKGLNRYNEFMKYVYQNRHVFESAKEVEDKYVRHRLGIQVDLCNENDIDGGGEDEMVEVVHDLFGVDHGRREDRVEDAGSPCSGRMQEMMELTFEEEEDEAICDAEAVSFGRERDGSEATGADCETRNEERHGGTEDESTPEACEIVEEEENCNENPGRTEDGIISVEQHDANDEHEESGVGESESIRSNTQLECDKEPEAIAHHNQHLKDRQQKKHRNKRYHGKSKKRRMD